MTPTPLDNRIRRYQLLLVSLGAAALLYEAVRLLRQPLDPTWLAIGLFAILFSQLAAARIPSSSNAVTSSDTFIFLTLLISGPGPAIIVAASASASDSARHTRRWLTLATNVAVICLSLFLACLLVSLTFGDLRLLAHRRETFFIYAAGLLLLSATQGFFNTLLLTPVVTLRTGAPLLRTWYEQYAWVLVTPISGSVMAGVTSAFVHYYGLWAALLALPLMAATWLAARPYLKNIEAAERHLAELQVSESRFRSAFDHSAVGMALLDPQGRWLEVNRALCQLTGYSEPELRGRHFQALVHPHDLGAALVQLHQLLDGQIPAFQLEQRYLHRHGHTLCLIWSVSLVRELATREQRLIFQFQDITDRKQAEAQLLHDAFHDALTGLPNRALFLDHLGLAMERLRRHPGWHHAVLFLDFDRFKIINDSLSHAVGDQLLVAVARRLEGCLRPGDTIARLGGDEFTILLEGLGPISEASEIAERIQQSLEQPFEVAGHEVYTTVSIGIAHSALGYEQPEEMLRDADTAMYRAKARGTSRYEIFDRAMHSQVATRLQMENDLRRAIERGEFFLCYQPIVRLESGRLEGFEALIRWNHPERGVISPARFIPVAEETGLIVPIGQWVLREACRQMKEWEVEYPAAFPLQMSVNLSGRQFVQPDLLGEINRVLSETGLAPERLKLELTESVVMENIETAVSLLRQIRELGIELSIDDFGTGYSSLSYLHSFPLSTLKIDRSFVMQMGDQDENTEIVGTIVTLARTLRMEVIAEGVETLEQLDQLRALSCQYGQGYYFSRPVDSQAAGILLRENRQWPVVAARLIPHDQEAAASKAGTFTM
ncbi:MAG TPA: EAL domain-containing protein [Blastocatellia bacterium]|nr:EAL domain-containing protein [Blastocatellia bacterium]